MKPGVHTKQSGKSAPAAGASGRNSVSLRGHDRLGTGMRFLHHEVRLEGSGGKKTCKTRNMEGFAPFDVKVVCHMMWERKCSGMRAVTNDPTC